jgi:hypothetical protein
VNGFMMREFLSVNILKLLYNEAVSKFLLIAVGQRQGCQMVYFQTKKPNLGTFWRALEWKMFLYFVIIWNILWPFGIIYGSLV